MKKIIILLIIGIALLSCSLIVEGTITFYDIGSGRGYNTRITSSDYLWNFSDALYQYDITVAPNLWNTSFGYQYIGYNTTLLIGKSAKGVNISIKDKQWYIQNIPKATNTSFITVYGATSSLNFKNFSLYLNDKSGKLLNLFILSGGLMGRKIWINNCFFKNLNGSTKAMSFTSRPVFVNDTIFDGFRIFAGNWYCRRVTVRNIFDSIACSGVVYSDNFNLINNLYAYQIAISQFNISNAFFVNNTYDIRFSSTANKNLFMFNCTFDKLLPSIYTVGSTFTGQLHLNYSFNYTIKNITGYVNNVNIRVWNRTGYLMKNINFNGNKTFNLDYGKWYKHFQFYFDVPYQINISNNNNLNEYENYTFNNSLSKVRETIFLSRKITNINSNIINNYTYNYGENFSMINPNPGNGTYNTNFIFKTYGVGTTTAIDIIYNNFTSFTENNYGKGKLGEHSNTITSSYDEPFSQTITDSNSKIQLFTIGFNGAVEDIVIKSITLRHVYLEKYLGSSINVQLYIFNAVPMLDLYSNVTYGKIIFDSSAELSGYYDLTINVTPVLLKNGWNYAFGITSNYTTEDFEKPISNTNIYNGGLMAYFIGGIIHYDNTKRLYFNITGWGIGSNISWNNIINITFSSNSSGFWTKYYTTRIIENGTTYYFNRNFSNISKYYWTVEAKSNNTILGNNTYNFEIQGINDDDWLYLGSTIMLENSQLFLVLFILLWTFFISKYYETKKSIFIIAQMLIGMPLSLMILGISYINSLSYGYLIGIMFLLLTFILPLYSYYSNKKEEREKSKTKRIF